MSTRRLVGILIPCCNEVENVVPIAQAVAALVRRVMPPFGSELIGDGKVLAAVWGDKKQTGRGITAVLFDGNLGLHVVRDAEPTGVALGCARSWKGSVGYTPRFAGRE